MASSLRTHTSLLGLPLLLSLLLLFNIDRCDALPKSALPLRSSRGVDDVGPALANATQNAIENAKDILANYTSVLHGVAIPAGLAVTFFGYFLLAPVLFLAAFVTGGGASFVAVSAILDGATSAPSSAWAAIISMLLGGALFGFLAMRALPVGMFAVGAALGVIFATSIRTSLIPQLFPKDPQTAFIATAVTLGLILGLLAVLFQKHMLIFCTAYAGACACVFGIGHFAGHFPTLDDFEKAQKGAVDTWLIVYLTLTAALGTAGMAFQFWLAADKPMPEYAPYDRRRRRRRRQRYQDPDDYDLDDWSEDPYVERVPLPPRNKRSSGHARPPPYPEQPVVQPVYVVAPQAAPPAPAPAPAPAPTAPPAQTQDAAFPASQPSAPTSMPSLQHSDIQPKSAPLPRSDASIGNLTTTTTTNSHLGQGLDEPHLVDLDLNEDVHASPSVSEDDGKDGNLYQADRIPSSCAAAVGNTDIAPMSAPNLQLF